MHDSLGGGLKITLVRLTIGLAFAAAAVTLFRAFHHAGFGVFAIVVFVYLSVLMVTIAVMIDFPRLPRQPKMSEIADDLARRRLLLSTSFCADRAFRVDECDGEGPHYFLELEDGGVLHLSGNYLYDYEPGDGSSRHFPCTRFTVRRHADLGYAVDILCSGLIIEPEVEAPPYTAWDFAHGLVPRDGQMLHNLTFDQLRQQRIAARYRMQ
jgi:hypothetical protein